MQTAIGWVLAGIMSLLRWVLAGIMSLLMGVVIGRIGLQIHAAWGDWAFYAYFGAGILLVTVDNWHRSKRRAW